MSKDLKCSILNCEDQAIFICKICNPEQHFCNKHNKEHIKFVKHSTFELKILTEIEMEENNFIEQTNKTVAYIYQISRHMIKFIEANTNRVIRDLFTMNKSVNDPLDLNILLFKENDIGDIYKRINKLFTTTTQRQNQLLIVNDQENQPIEEMENDVKSLCYLESLEKNFKLLSDQLVGHQSLLSQNYHKLTYYNRIKERLRFSGTHLNSSIFCDYCKLDVISSIWSCGCCNFDLCTACAIDQMKSKVVNRDTKKNCPKSHPLFYYSSSEKFYKRKTGGSSSVKCNFCSQKLEGELWSCRMCLFDLCSRCIKSDFSRQKSLNI